MSNLTEPPLYVPTLTEVVHSVTVPGAAFGALVTPAIIQVERQELLVQRLMRRIDLMLEQRLHEAIEELLAAHTDALMPRLREQIALVVRESVTQAFDQEAEPYQSRMPNQ